MPDRLASPPGPTAPSQVGDAPSAARRLDVLRSLAVLDSEPEESFDGITQAACALAGFPVALMALADTSRLWFKSRVGWPSPEIALTSSAFCWHVLTSRQALRVPDAAADGRFAHDALVTGPAGVRAYMGQPIMVAGECVGTLCVLDSNPRDLDPATFAVLARLASAASELLSARRHAAELERERERLIDFARASGDWIWETDAQHRYRWLSESFESTMGVARAEVIGKPFPDAPLVDAIGLPDPLGRRLHSVLAMRQRMRRLLTVQGSGEHRRFVSYSALPTLDASGRFDGYRGVARDLTSQVAADQAAHRRDEAVQTTMALLPGAVLQFVEYKDGRQAIPFASDKIKDIFGVSAAQAMSGGIVLRDHIDALQLAAGIAGRRQAVARSEPWRGEFHLRSAERGERWIDVHAMPERLPGGGVHWHTILADITEQRATRLALEATRERWAMAATVASIGVIEVDLVGGRMTMDAIARHHLGYRDDQSEPRLATCLRRIAAPGRRALRQRITQAIAADRPFDDVFTLRLPGGEERFVAITGQAYRDADGRPSHLLCTCSDKTEQRRAEQLELDKTAAERASRAKSEFLSRVSHELRTPLHGILGFAHLMSLDQDTPLSVPQQRRLQHVLHSGRHLLDLINDMLDLSRIEAGRLELDIAVIDAAAAVRAAAATLAPMASTRGIEIRVTETGPLPSRVAADRRALEQVLANLISNAIKYNRDHGRVTITVECAESRIRIAVADDGRGLSPAECTLLFMPFNRLGAERSRTEGTGLGLVIARQLTQAMKGDIEVTSTVGVGSRFTIDLPRAEGPVDIRPIPEMAPPPVPGARAAPAPRRSSRCVLYVEDDEFNRLLLSQVFADRTDWQLHLAGSVAEGVDMATRLRPDLILADMNLPDGHGIDLIARVHHALPAHPVRMAALSADALPQQIEAALSAGFERYWTKPVDLTLLLAWLDDILA